VIRVTCAALPLLVFSLLLPAAPAIAQSQWVSRELRPALAAEWIKPRFDTLEFSRATSTLFLTGAYPIGNVLFVAELPLAYAAPVGGSGRQAVGNPYFGIHRPIGPLHADIGVRLPLAREYGEDDLASYTGVFSDLSRFEAFLRDDLTFVFLAEQRYAGERAGARLQAGPVLPVYVGPHPWRAAYHLWLSYALLSYVQIGPAQIGADVLGRWILSESGPWSDRMMHRLAVSGSYEAGAIRPSGRVWLPLSGRVRTLLEPSFGFSVEYAWPERP
jgi:hypothetical protein